MVVAVSAGSGRRGGDMKAAISCGIQVDAGGVRQGGRRHLLGFPSRCRPHG